MKLHLRVRNRIQAVAWLRRQGWIVCLGLLLPAARVQAQSASTDTLGCRFRFASSGTSYIDNPNKRYSCRFTSDLDLTVDRFEVNLTSAAGNPEVVVDLVPDANGVPGDPSLATATLYPGTLGGVPLFGMFASSASLTNRGVYHLVFRVANGSTTDKLGLRHVTSADFSCNQRTGRPDPMLNRLYSSNAGATWSAPADQENGAVHAFTVGNAAGEAIGQPYTAGYNTPGVGLTTLRGQRFVYDAGPGHAVTALMVRVTKGAGNAADDLRVYLLDETMSIVSSNVLLGAGFTNTVPTNYGLSLQKPLKLTPDDTYTLALESKGSSGNSYILSLPYSNQTNAFAATFQGTNGTAVYGSSLATLITPNSSAAIAYDLTFALYTAFIPPQGTMVLIR